jgi:RimJ/RimL family protein N-acetyltransferase
MSIERPNDEFIDFRCPGCGASLSFPEARLGTAQGCPHCFETVVVSPTGSEKRGKLPLPIKTPRLNLRPLKTEDLPDLLEFVKDEDSYKYLTNYPPDDEEAKSWLEKSKASRLTHPKGWLALAVELQNDAKVIGHLSFFLNDPEEHRQGSFDILMHPACRCRGYGTEALLGFFNFGFNGTALHDIRVRIDIRNLAGRRMVEKAGMKLEGEFIEQWRVKGEWASAAYYMILSAWWQRAPAS